MGSRRTVDLMTRRRAVAGSRPALVLLALAISLAGMVGQARGSSDTASGAGRPRSTPPVEASKPNEDLVRLLKSPIGLVGGGLLVIGAGAATTAALVPHLPTRDPTPRRRRSGRRSGRRYGRERVPLAPARPNQPLVAALIIAGCFLLPLIFTIALTDVFALPKSLALWLLAGTLVVVLTHAAIHGGRPLHAGFLDTAVVTFVLLNVAATAISADPLHGVLGESQQYQGLVSMTAYGILFIGARYAFADASHVRVLSVGLAVSGALASAYAVVQQIGLDPIWTELFRGRVFSTVGQANALAAVLATSLVMLIPLGAIFGPRSRAALLACGGLTAVAFALTFSRGGYLGLAVGLVVAAAVVLPGIGWAASRRYLASGAMVAIAAVAVIALVSVAWRPAGDLIERVTTRAATIMDPNESSNRIRLDLWTVSLHMTADKPFLGTGPDSYVSAFPSYRDDVLPPDRAAHLATFRPESPHNVYLAIATGSGIPSLAMFLAVVAGSLWLSARAALRAIPWTTRLALAGLGAAATLQLVTNAFMTGEASSFALWSVILGALAGVGEHAAGTLGPPEHSETEAA